MGRHSQLLLAQIRSLVIRRCKARRFVLQCLKVILNIPTSSELYKGSALHLSLLSPDRNFSSSSFKPIVLLCSSSKSLPLMISLSALSACCSFPFFSLSFSSLSFSFCFLFVFSSLHASIAAYIYIHSTSTQRTIPISLCMMFPNGVR